MSKTEKIEEWLILSSMILFLISIALSWLISDFAFLSGAILAVLMVFSALMLQQARAMRLLK